MIGLLLVFAWPWGNRNSRELRDRYEQRSDLARVAPGVFQSSSDGSRVFFIERDGADAVNARNVFVLQTRNGIESVTSARSGRLELSGDDRFLVLDNGQRSDVNANTARDHARALRQLPRAGRSTQRCASANELPPKATATLDLLRDRTLQPSGRTGVALRACCSVRST